MRNVIFVALSAALVAACVPTPGELTDNPNAPRVSASTALAPAETYRVVNANVVHCFAGANYNIASAEGVGTRASQIIINSSLGHLLSVIDFTSDNAGTRVTATVGYKLGQQGRADEWQKALNSWLVEGKQDYCPRMP